ncbi:Aminotransferase-like, plant mobile domain [Sesbania bispinosa]|nr:Aminotransferase-like, plant mobile domain [Sesbania bispinosa]
MVKSRGGRGSGSPTASARQRCLQGRSSGYLFVERSCEYIARRLWSSEGDINGRKLKRLENDYVRDIVDDSGLGPLVEGTHSLVDRSMLFAFTERWHKDTSSFHLPMGEMTITLDDVNSLLHILVHGRFFFLSSMGKNDANKLLVTLLGVSYSDVVAGTNYIRGHNVRLSWLRSVYENKLEQNHLIATSVWVHYLELFRVLASMSQIAWGSVALAYLYEQLNEASLHQTCQLAGYSTLLQAWILEHFPHITAIERSFDYEEGMPLCRRFRNHRQDYLLDESRRGPVITYAGECSDGYLEWFRMVSHPYLIPMRIEFMIHYLVECQHSIYRERLVGLRIYLVGPKTIVLIRFFFAGIMERLQALLSTDMVTVGSDGEMLTHKALRMAQLGL